MIIIKKVLATQIGKRDLYNLVYIPFVFKYENFIEETGIVIG